MTLEAGRFESAILYKEEGKHKALVLANEIRCHTHWSGTLFRFISLIALSAAAILLFILLRFSINFFDALQLSLFFAFLVWSPLLWTRFRYSASKVYHRSKDTFWDRNKDRVIIGFSFLVLGMILKTFIDRFFG